MFETFSETHLRVGVFVAVLVVLALAEAWRPRRGRTFARAARWTTNLTIVALGALVVRLLAFLAATISVPLVAVVAAVFAERTGTGLLNWIALPGWLAAAVAFVVLDFAIWLQHWLSHHVPVFWRLHRVHHADRDFDVTTALRFHPVEIGLSMLYKVVWVLALGAPVASVIAFEIVLNALAMFNHANLALPERVDRVLRRVIVTPDMHRVHHSVHVREHNSNFGFNFSIWDRLFATYTAEPRDGHEAMTIGLSAYQSEQPTRLGWSLKLPFVGK